MRDDQKTKAELLQELDTWRHRVSGLKQAAEQWSQTFDATSDLVFVQDKDFKFIKVNKSVCDLLKVKPEDLIGKKCYEVLHKSDKPWPNCPAVKTLKDKRPHTEEVCDPNIGMPLLITTSPSFDENGELTGVVHIATDITDRKKAEDVLRESEQRYRDIFNSATDAILILDLEDHIVDANFEACKMFGYSRDEMIGLAVQKLVHPDYRRKPEEFRNEIETKGRIHFEAVNLRKDGTQLNVAVRGTIFTHNGKKHFFIAIRDVTERKKALEELQSKTAILQNIIANIPHYVFWKDKNSIYLGCNDNFARLAGVEEIKDIVGKNDYDLPWKKEESDFYRKIDKEVMSKNAPILNIEEQVHSGKSKAATLLTSKVPLRNADGEVTGVLGIFTDITERKKAEDELQESEQRFRAIFDGAADGMLLADLESKKFQTANKMICQMLGYNPEEIKNLGVADIHPEEDLPYVIEQFEKQSRGEFTLSRDIPVKRKDGSVFYADINSVTITLRGKTYLMGIFRDITDRKRAEEALRDSESKYRTLVENLPQKIFLKDKNSVFVSCNDNLARDFKIKSEEIAGKTDYDFLPKELADKYRADDKRIIESGQTEAIEEKYIEEGEERIVHTVKTPVKDEQGNVIGVLGIFWDITELKRKEEELNIYRENIVQAEELAAVGTLSATLAHELTQPLTVIGLSIGNSLAELEKRSCPDTVVEDLKEGLSEVSSITLMVDRFRNFARMSAKRAVSEVDFKAVAERIVKLLDESAWRAKVTLQVEGMDKLPLIYSYERDLEQLFFSLIENAIQAADGKKKHRIIISGAVRDDEYIELQFSDNCGGIAPENLDRIFEPFFTTKDAHERTGLGLCVVERIVSQLDGQVRVESELGKGSTFFVTLPINRDE